MAASQLIKLPHNIDCDEMLYWSKYMGDQVRADDYKYLEDWRTAWPYWILLEHLHNEAREF